jgi:predicted dehydrogenase
MNGVLFGYGSIGRRHAAVLAATVEELAIVDTTAAARERAGAAHPTAAVFESLESFRRSSWDPDSTLAVIATWGPSHAELFHALVDRGIRRILCEKPMAVSVHAAHEMVQRAEKEGVSMAVHHFMRYGGLVQALERFATKHELGNPVSLVVEGGAAGIVTNGIHWIDLAAGLFSSQPRQVISTAYGEGINPRSPDVHLYGGTVTWTFAEGREAVVTFNNHSSISMIGRVFYRDASIEIDDELNVIARARDMKAVEQFPSITRTGPVVADLFRGQLPGMSSLADGMNAALSEIQHGEGITVPGSAGVAAVSSCVGALLASRRKETVLLPIDPDTMEGKELWPMS